MEEDSYKNIREDILEGLRYAVSKGESLQQAMQSFYNAGYERLDIEKAARTLQLQGMPQEIQSNEQASQEYLIKQEKKSFFSKLNPFKKKPKQANQYKQKVSSYRQEAKSPNKMIILLAIVLIFLLGLLAALFFFSDQILDFYNKLTA